MRQLLSILLLLTSLSLLTACSDSAGATSETTNGVAVLYEDGTPARAVSVFVRQSDKLLSSDEKPDSLHTRTSDKGYFELDSLLSPDNYLIELTDSNGNGFQFTPDTSNGEIVLPDTIILKKQGLLHGSIQEYATETRETHSVPSDYVIQIYGLDRVTQVTQSGTFSFTDLPAGDIRLHIVNSTTDKQIVESDKFDIFPDDTTTTGNYIVGGSLENERDIVLKFLRANDIDDSILDSCIRIQNDHIAHIYLDDRGIHTLIPELGHLRLKTFSCARNEITTVPKEFGHMVDLYYIDLSYNQIQYLPSEMANMSKISEIDVEYNKLREIPESFTAENKLTHLHEIHIKGNCLTDPPRSIRKWLFEYSSEKNWQDYQTEWEE